MPVPPCRAYGLDEEPIPEIEAETVHYCAGVLHHASRMSPPEFCENEVEEEGDLCYWCDPDGAAADAAETRAEEARYGI